jgi:DNA-directed RNA polymerase subunit RPC12/RpoP
MSDGKHCPACGKDIGLWSVLTAGLPTRVRCPHCSTRLSYGGDSTLMICLFAILLAAGAAAFYFARQLHPITQSRFYITLVLLALALMLPVELAATFYLRRHGILIKAK